MDKELQDPIGLAPDSKTEIPERPRRTWRLNCRLRRVIEYLTLIAHWFIILEAIEHAMRPLIA
jgi:hypothetical protein